MKKLDLEKIKQLRKDNKLSQGDMSEIIGLGSMYSYHRKEKGSQPFTAEELHEIANHFNVSSEYFFDVELARTAIK